MGFYKSGKEDISEVKKDYSKNKLMTLILICLIVLITFVYFAISKWVENKFEFDKLGKAGGFKLEEYDTTITNFSEPVGVDVSNQVGLFWVTYPSSHGETASPVAFVQHTSITNLEDIPQTIQSYEVSVKSKDCSWMKLTTIPTRGMSFWFTYGGLSDGKLVLFSSSSLDQMLNSPIPPHGTITGWWFFDTSHSCTGGNKNQAEEMNVVFKTFEGKTFEIKKELKVPLNPNQEAFTQGATLVFPHKESAASHSDLSRLYIKTFSRE